MSNAPILNQPREALLRKNRSVSEQEVKTQQTKLHNYNKSSRISTYHHLAVRTSSLPRNDTYPPEKTSRYEGKQIGAVSRQPLSC